MSIFCQHMIHAVFTERKRKQDVDLLLLSAVKEVKGKLLIHLK